MAQILQGRVFEKNMNDFYQGIQANQNQQQINEAKKQNQMKAMEKYFADLALSNDLGSYGVLLDHGDTVKQYLGMAGVKDVEGEYQNALKQGLTPEIERRLWLRTQTGNVVDGGGGSQVSPEPAPQTTPTPQNIPNPTLNLAPAEQGFQQNVQTQTATSSSGQAFPDNPSADMGEFATNRTPSQRDLGAGIAGYAPVIAKQGGSFKPTSASSRRTSEVQNADIGKIQNGRFIPTAYTAKADKNAIVTSMLVSSGYDPSKIEEKDIRDYENFLINANGLKSRDELWSGKGFKVPPRVIGQNEMDIISKLTPELQKQYATLVEQKEKALKAGNNGGAAKAQERMNQIATKGGVPRSPYTISDEQYNRFGAIFGVGTKEEVDATLMQLAQMDSGAMDAALNQAKIDEASSQIILNGVKTKQAKMEMEAVQQQLENGGLTPKDALEYQIKLTELNTKQFNLQQAPIEALAKSEKAVVDLYNSTTGKKPQTDRDKITWVNQMVKTNNPIINQYKQNYLFNLEQNAYGLIPKEGEDEASFKIRIARARETARENMDSLIVDQLSTSLGLTPEKERTLWDKLTNRSGGRTGATASDLNRIPPKDQVVRGSSESDIANKVIQRNKGAR